MHDAFPGPNPNAFLPLCTQVTASQPDRLLLLVEALAGGGTGGGGGLVFKSSRHSIAMLTPTGGSPPLARAYPTRTLPRGAGADHLLPYS